MIVIPERPREGKPEVTPKPMGFDDFRRVKAEYKSAAERAKRAGFDGIQMHCGYGFLLDSFLRDGSNTRKDLYGGSVENRARFPLEILDLLVTTWGSPKGVGVKLSPVNDYNQMSDSNPNETFSYMINELNARKIAFAEVVEGFRGGTFSTDISTIKEPFNARYKKSFKGTWISNYGYDFTTANEHISKNQTDMVSFGWPYVCNPDLVEKFASGAELYSVKNIKDMS
jgi:N-ethylmaleimide reductase